MSVIPCLLDAAHESEHTSPFPMNNRYPRPSFNASTHVCVLIAAVLFVLSSASTRAQASWIESNVGLEGAYVAALGFDSTGRALGATACGLYRLDANRWSVILDRDSVSAIVATPSGTLLAGTTSGLWRGSSEGSTWTRVHDGVNTSELLALGGDSLLAIIGAKLHRSTDDGLTWTPVDDLPQVAAGRLAVARDGQIYAWRFSGLYRSSDRGTTWTSLTQTLPMTQIAPITGDRLLGVYADSLYQSIDAGRRWWVVRQLPANDLRCGPSGRILAAVGLPRMLAATPATPPGTYVLGDDGSIASMLRPGLAHSIAEGPDGNLVIGANPDLFVSSDGAASWDLIDAGLDCAMMSNITIDRAGRMYGMLKGIRWITEPYSLGSLHRSLDSGRTWRRLTDGVVAILGAFASGEVLLAAIDTTGAQVVRASRDHGVSWRDLSTPPTIPFVSGNDSGVVALSFTWTGTDPTDSSSKLWLSTDTAATWTVRSTGRRASYVLATSEAVLLAGAVEPNGRDLYRSSDAGATWTRVIESQIVSIQVAPDGDLFVVSIGSGLSVRLSTDGGLTWERRGSFSAFNGAPLLFSPNGDLIATGTSTRNSLARSTDDGATWTDVEVPWTSPTSVSIPVDGRFVGIASDAVGVYAWESRDAGATWRASTYPALASPSLKLAPWGELFTGVGPQRLLRLDGPLSSIQREHAGSVGLDLGVSPLPARGTVRLTVDVDVPADALISLYSADGRCHIPASHHRLEAGGNSIAVDVADLSPGIYVAIVATPRGVVSERVVVH